MRSVICAKRSPDRLVSLNTRTYIFGCTCVCVAEAFRELFLGGGGSGHSHSGSWGEGLKDPPNPDLACFGGGPKPP